MVHNDCKDMGVSKKVESNNGAEIISCGPFIAEHAAKIKHGEAAAMEDFTLSQLMNNSWNSREKNEDGNEYNIITK